MKNVILMNMSGVCLNQEMFKSEAVEIIECKELSGTDCYCDDVAAQKLKELIEPYSENALHYIDGGNYHYLSKLWTGKIEKDFDLVVFDHHPDMQPPLFGPILSCGSWIKDTIESNPNLKNVYIIGVNEELITDEMRAADSIDSNDGAQKIKIKPEIHFITKQELDEIRKMSCELNSSRLNNSKIIEKISEIVTKTEKNDDMCKSQQNDIYISIDKDVLSENEYKTNWDQGNMSVEELFVILEQICRERKVIGIDVCGEMDLAYAHENPQWNITNNIVNNRLMHFINYLEKN